MQNNGRPAGRLSQFLIRRRRFAGAALLLTALAFSDAGAGEPLPGTDQAVPAQWLAAWKAQSDEPTRYINRLVLSDSAYLRQHADNPIDWYPWSEPALDRARRENRLIFLSIGYASCHWCHVMEKESFANATVAEVLNRAFVSIKVDREAHPDVDYYYSQAVEIMQGESGWPITVVLTPERKIFLAASYLPREALLSMLQRSRKLWTENPDWVQQNAKLISGQVDQRFAVVSDADSRFDRTWLVNAREALLSSIDGALGGFGTGAKFPSELKLHFLLQRLKVNPSGELEATLRQQLDRLMYSGISDAVFGGVFRYTTDRAMQKPHFEKMLYNQALMTSLFADAADWLARPAYAAYAAAIADFVERRMRLPDGGYAAAVDADHRGVEGGYYLWPAEALGDAPGGIKRIRFGDHGVFAYREAESEHQNAFLRQLQARRTEAPRVIRNRVTAWNALWLSALIRLDELNLAEALADLLWRENWHDGQLSRLAGQAGYLDDYSYLARAYWELYFATKAPTWKSRARVLARAILTHFYRDGALYYQDDRTDAVTRIETYHDEVLPNAAATALWVFQYQQTEFEFIQAVQAIERRAYGRAVRAPHNYLSLLQQGIGDTPRSDQVIAKGHAIVSLKADVGADAWRLQFDFEDDWHVNASEVLDQSLIPTQIVSDDPGLSVQYPEGQRKSLGFTDQPLLLYDGEVTIPITTSGASQRLSVRLRYQACNDKVCLPPENIPLTATRDVSE